MPDDRLAEILGRETACSIVGEASLPLEPRHSSVRVDTTENMGKLPPVKPTGGAIAISAAVGLAAAAACTQLLTLNMPFGACSRRIREVAPPRLGSTPRASVVRARIGARAP